MRFLLAIFGGLLSVTASANCDEFVSPSDLAHQVSLGDAAYTEMDPTALGQSMLWLYESLPCLSDGLKPGQVTSLHRLQALSAFLAEDHGLTTLYFRSVLASAPDYELPDYLAPEGNLLRLHFEVAQSMPPVPAREIPAPRRGMILVDGQPVLAVPQDRPYLFQYFDENSDIRHTTLLMPNEELPRYPSDARRGGRVRLPLAILSGTAALGSGTLVWMANRAEADFWDSGTAVAELEALQRRANGLSWASLAVGTVAVGTGVAALWTGSF